MLAVGIAALASTAAPACGREDVLLVDEPAEGAESGGPDGRALGEGGRGEGGSCPDASSRPCRGLGESCAAAQDCCSDRCEGAVCLPASCGAPGAACTTRDQCCSALCEPVSGTPNRACLRYCKRAGAGCARAQDCCSLACLSGTCAAALCVKTGGNCTGDGDCCSGRCPTGRCQLDIALSCRPSGEDCNSGGGVECCATCNQDQRCDIGPGACRALGAACTTAAECCAGMCARIGQGPLLCTGPCIIEGAACTMSADCCGGTCSGEPPACRAQVSACKLLGIDCAGDGECCSGQCLGGRCGDNCAGPR